MRNFLKLSMLWVMLWVVHHVAKAQNNHTPYVPGEFIIKFNEGKSASKTNHLTTKMQAKVSEKMPSMGLELWKINQTDAKLGVMELIEQYKNHPDIDFIEPNYLYSISNVNQPNPEIGKQWALENDGSLPNSVEGADIKATDAWQIKSESPNIVVGILDTGIDWRHPDLIENIWQNSGEDLDGDGLLIFKNGRWIFDPKDDNGVDDDDNGYIDDFIGWNFVDKNNEPFDYDALDAGEYVQPHGTHVAGIIGATGDNGIGISGVTKNVQLAPLKFLTDKEKSTGTAWHAAAAIDYAVNMGMQISNNSWGGGINSISTPIIRAIKRAELNNHLFIAAAGNGGWDKIGDDIIHFYPSNYDNSNIISVANTNFSDTINSSSNYSVYHVDIAAPGSGIYSCIPNQPTNQAGTYDFMSGTSMAAPMVAGACALLWEKGLEVFGDLQVTHIKNALLENVDSLPQLKDKVSSGRLNVYKALTALEDASYIAKYTNCRMRDSLALLTIHTALELDITEYAWHTNNNSMENWNGIKLNSLGCVDKFEVIPHIKNAIPIELGELKDLTYLSIIYFTDAVDNGVNISVPQQIFDLKKMKYLKFIRNNLAGPIPSEIGQLTNLETLSLFNNNLTGNIPAEIWELPKLTNLALSFNQLTGELSGAVNQLKNLNGLVLNNNQFSGSIPAFNKNLKLQTVSLSNNNFSGQIPTLQNPHTIYYISLNDNQLTGSLDPLLSWFSVNIDKVWEFRVNNNAFSGCYDPALAKMGRQKLDGDEGIAFSNSEISEGNLFENTWENFILNGDNSCWATKTSQVWPGDTNNDGVVDVDDYVFHEQALDDTGTARRNNPDITEVDESYYTTWIGQICPDWVTNILGVNGKHQDANGDGIVDMLDHQAITNNMGKTNPNHIATHNLTFYDNDSGIELQLRLDEAESLNHQNNTGSEEEFIFKLYVNDIETEAPAELHNLSANVAFNKNVEIRSFEFINEDDCLVIPDSKFFLDTTSTINELEFYFKRQDVTLGNCGEEVAKIVIMVEEDSAIDGGNFLQFKVDKSIHSVDGNEIDRTIPSNSFSSLNIGTGNELHIQLTTKPERCKFGGSAFAEVFGGQGLYTYSWTSEDGISWIEDSEIEGLQAGRYSLTVTDEAGSIQVIAFDIQNLLVYDEDGITLNCETYIETYCPDDLNLVNDIPQDTYNASNYINTDGKILEGDEVELRAGEYIRLAPGFKMESNTSLIIKIENCSDEN